MKYMLVCVAISLFGSLHGFAGETQEESGTPERSALVIGDLNPTLDGKRVTVRFTVAQLEPVTQRHVPGQAPTFIIEPKSEHDKKSLSVWIEGQLANVLDRLQMSVFQSNPIAQGTTIIASGELRIHRDKKDGELYLLYVKKWKAFRIVPPDKTE